MKILIVPDSFKGTLTSAQVCDAIEKGLLEYDKELEITKLPFADGGEGFSECFANFCKGEWLYTSCSDIYNKVKRCSYYTFDDTAVIECAMASGLQKRKDIMQATSYGTGELIKHAVSRGFHNIILGLGGSGCCDGGAGALTALGAVFKDINGDIIDFPAGKDLNNIYGANFRNTVKDIKFTFACDVENLFFGPTGASYVFAEQKGANKQQIRELDDGLKMLNAFLPVDVSKIKGAGAAGGICGGLYSVYGGNIESGFSVLSRYSNLEEKIKSADIIITGEGKTDRQTLMGKLPYQISRICNKYDKECILISGSIDDTKICKRQFSVIDKTTSLEEALQNPFETLANRSTQILTAV